MDSITVPNSGDSQVYVLLPNLSLKFQTYISNYLDYGDKVAF